MSVDVYLNIQELGYTSEEVSFLFYVYWDSSNLQ